MKNKDIYIAQINNHLADIGLTLSEWIIDLSQSIPEGNYYKVNNEYFEN